MKTELLLQLEEVQNALHVTLRNKITLVEVWARLYGPYYLV